MELQGKIIAALPERSGVSARVNGKCRSLCSKHLMLSTLARWCSTSLAQSVCSVLIFRSDRQCSWLSILMPVSIMVAGSTLSVPSTFVRWMLLSQWLLRLLMQCLFLLLRLWVLLPLLLLLRKRLLIVQTTCHSNPTHIRFPF